MKSCLEKRSMEERHVEEVRSDYNRENVYSVTHPDALATGDAQGKGTGYGGHTFSLPNCSSKPLNSWLKTMSSPPINLDL